MNKSMCEEIFGREMDVPEKAPEPFKSDKSQVRQYRDWLHVRNERQLEILQNVELALEKIDRFSRIKKNMHLPIKDGIQEALKELGALRYDMEDTVCYLDSFEYLMRGLMVQKMKEVRPSKSKEVADDGSQTLPQPTARSTPDTRKRIRGPTVSPEASAAKKSADKRSKASNKEEKGVWFHSGETSKKIRRRNLPERRRNLAVRAQKRCSLNRQRE